MAARNNEENNCYDFEASIQISRILKILSETIKNSEVILCLPLLLADECAILHQYFSPEQVIFIKETCKKISQKEISSSDDTETQNKSDMCLAINLLLSVPQLGDHCRENLTDAISPGGTDLLRDLEELRICVAERLRITPKMEVQQDAELRQLYQQNITKREEVGRLTEKLIKLTAETEQEIEEKNQLIKQQIDKITKVKKECRDNMKKKMDEAERQISWDIKNSEYHLSILQADARNAQYHREIQLKEHLNTEKELRAKRNKLESQLEALLQKYDSDIGERHALLEELTANYDEEKNQLALLQQNYDEQETEYIKLMLEKEQYERKQWEAKLYNIQCRIAARKIQRFYRAYLAAKSKGKKGKKGKKKK